MLGKIYGILFLLCVHSGVRGEYVFPELEFSAFSPKGLRVELPDQPGVQLFAFHGRLNEPLAASKEGEINGDITEPTNGKWVFEDPNIVLDVGDKLYYWAYVQFNRAGYALRDKQWEVTTYVSNDRGTCAKPVTVASGVDSSFCAGSVIFEDDFNQANIDRNKWIVQQYIPTFAADDHYEFVSYQDRTGNIFIRNSILYLKPVVAASRSDITGTLDLTQGCTRSKPVSCSHTSVGVIIIPPIVSGKILSKMSFRFGKIEIKAKVPIGDWIYPQIELIPRGKLPSYPKILLAYTRGNQNLTLNNNDDIGNTLLFGGPVSSPTEPDRSKNLRSRRFPFLLGRDVRTYTVEWSPSKIDLKVDSEKYGTILSNEYSGLTSEYQIALGVGVGGNYDFPDFLRSGTYSKPWTNFGQRYLRDFYNQKNMWESTWYGDDVALQIDSVKVTAL